MSIQLLPEELINKIAAGEVVERPCSVVKELLENALDACATQIEIDISEGGRKSIQIRDNGSGISAFELPLALSRHATSKIKTIDDLFAIQTLGFRGEALASIASVSTLSLTSRKKGESEAHTLVVEGGRVLEEGVRAHPEGTTVSVKYLFQQVPARLKFLKSPETELAQITDTVIKAALANPSVSFRLSHNSKKIIFCPQAPSLKARALDLFGEDLTDALYEVSGGREGLELTGLISYPTVSRSHPRNVYFYVNGRPVKDKMLTHALFEGYRDLLMKGRYPVAILFLKVPHEMVDVNVHPAKTEVRFTQTSVIHNLVMEAIRTTLTSQPWKPESSSPSYFKPKEASSFSPSAPNDNSFFSILSNSLNEKSSSESLREELPLISSGSLNRQVSFGKTPYREMQLLGQFLATYLIAESDEKLILIDQHAAHERIGFEKLLLQHQKGGVLCEPLLIPETFDLLPSEAEILKKYCEELKGLGLEIEFFGGNTFVLKSIPVLLKGKIKVKDLVLDLVGETLEAGQLKSLTDRFHEVFARMSCHGAIRANHRLTLPEMRALLAELDEYQNTSFCPHGRPVAIEMTRYEIEKWFKRVV